MSQNTSPSFNSNPPGTSMCMREVAGLNLIIRGMGGDPRTTVAIKKKRYFNGCLGRYENILVVWSIVRSRPKPPRRLGKESKICNVSTSWGESCLTKFFLQKQQFQLGSFLRKLRGKARKSTHLSESIMEHALRTRCKTLYNPYAHKKDLGLGPLIATP